MTLIKCTDCGRDVSDQAPACPNCGRRMVVRWEYRDLTIPLSGREWNTGKKDLTDQNERFQQLLAEHLQRALREGWEPDEPTDYAWLFRNGRVDVRSSPGLFDTVFDIVN